MDGTSQDLRPRKLVHKGVFAPILVFCKIQVKTATPRQKNRTRTPIVLKPLRFQVLTGFIQLEPGGSDGAFVKYIELETPVNLH